MKKISFLLITLVCVFSINSFAVTRDWSRIWGSSDSDYGNCVSVDNAGNVYVAGNTWGSFDGQINNGTMDLCLTKYNNSGSSLWTRIWGSNASDSGNGVNVDGLGNVYVAGSTSASFDGQTNNGHTDLCLTKFNNNGTKQWTRIWGSAVYDAGRSISVDSAGSIYVAGETQGSFAGQTNNGNMDLYLTKYNSNGSSLWSRIWGSYDYDYGICVSIDSTGNIYVAGNTLNSFDGQTNNGSSDLCLTKYNNDGVKRWTRIWGSSAGDYAQGVSVDKAGNIYVTGFTYGSFDGQSKNGYQDLCLTKFNSSGTKQWTRIWGSADSDEGMSVSVDSIGDIYVSGYTEGSFDGEINNGYQDLCLTKFNSSGTKQWTRIWGSFNFDGGRGVSIDSVGNIYIAGYTDSSFDGQSNNGSWDFCLTKYIDIITLISPKNICETNDLTLSFDIYYNESIINQTKKFISTNAGQSWFNYTNNITFPSYGTYYWTARGMDYSNDFHYADATNTLIIVPEINLVIFIIPLILIIIRKEISCFAYAK